MSHHGSGAGSDKLIAALGDMAKAAQKKLQGEYPHGRISEVDEGAVAVVVGHEKGKVILSFAHPTAWIGLTPEIAMDIAQALIEHARAAGLVGVYTITFGGKDRG